METEIQLFRYDEKLSGVGLGEPSITLIENDVAFSVLLSESAHTDSYTNRLYLDQVLLLRVKGKGYSYGDFQAVAVYRHDEGVWVAEDVLTGRFFHEPSTCPYHVIFISPKDYSQLMAVRSEEIARPIFQFTQKTFGRLPGFRYAANRLETPNGYADAGEMLSGDQYVLTK